MNKTTVVTRHRAEEPMKLIVVSLVILAIVWAIPYRGDDGSALITSLALRVLLSIIPGFALHSAWQARRKRVQG